jgi:putative FmdB family regulatory protein
MPIYEYRCNACGHELEALQKITETPLKECPSCRTDALTKLLSAAGFQLKGSGWYATDFRNGSKPAAKPEAKPEAKAEAAASKTDAAKSDAGSTDSSGGKSESKTEAASTAGGCGTSCACH